MIELFAATTSGKVGRVLRNGLTKPFRGYAFAEMAAAEAEYKTMDREGVDPVVLRIQVDQRNLKPDHNAYDNPPIEAMVQAGVESEEEWMSKGYAGEIAIPEDESDWTTSLDTVFSVIHEGEVDPRYIWEERGATS